MSEKMRDSDVDWIGEIPEGWEVSKIKYVAELDPVKSEIIRENFIGKKVTFLPMDKLKKGHLILDSVADFIEVFSSYNYFAEGDILFAKVTPSFENGNIGIAKNLRNGIGFGSSEIYTLRAHNIDTNFLYYWLQNQQFKSEAVSNMYGVAGLKRVPAEFIKNHVILLPISRIDQKAIADYLDKQTSKFDQAQKLLKDEIERLRAYKKSLIYETVTKGLDKNVQFKDSGVDWIGEIPVGWEVSPLKFLTTKIGSGKTPLGGAETYLDEGIMLLRSQNIYSEALRLDDVVRISEEVFREMQSTSVNKNDVLLNITGASIGRVGFYDLNEKANVNQHVSIIRTKIDFLSPKYLFYVLQSSVGQNYISTYQFGGNREGLNFQQIGNFRLPVPELTIQNEIGNYLDKKINKVNQIIKIKEQQLTNLSDQRRTLIYEVVTGKRN